ncbi:MAG: N-6 DNA methylase [Flavobacteriales bacterium]|nr:N-6 DNA methylase [Flavobacteriales bacterium]
MGYDMKDFRFELENTTAMFWRCADVLVNSGVPNKPELILFFLSAYKDGFLEDSLHNQHNYSFRRFQKNIYDDSFYEKVYKVFSSDIENIPSNKINEIIHILNYLDRSFLENHFDKIFELQLSKIIDYRGKRSGDSIQPLELSRLLINLANLKSNAKVYNPFAGLASYGIFLNKSQEYHGQEINPTTWAIGQLRLRAHNKGYGYGYELANSIENWNEFQKFDLIVATPPFKLPIPRHFHSQLTGESYGIVERFLIDRGIHSLSNNGKLIAVFPLSFLFKGGRDARLKKNLIDNDAIDTIITLPAGLFSNTNIPVCIIIIKIISRRPGYVRMIDASNYFTKVDPRNKLLNDQDLLQLIDNDSENEFLKYVTAEDIYDNEFDLSVGRYFLKNIQGSKLLSFSSIIRGVKAPINESMKQVQIRDLKDDVFDSVLTSYELESKRIKRRTFKVIDESCVLVATRWNTLKPTYFKYSGEPIAISQAVVALKLEEDKVVPTYLINEFAADYVKEQLDSYRVGSVQPMLRNKDLENIVIKLPTIQEQRAKVSGILELSTRLKKIESDKESLLSGIKKEETESSTSLSHILGKPLLNIGSSIEIIQNALTGMDPDWKQISLSKRLDFTMLDAFESISKNVQYIQELADQNTAVVSVSKFEFNEISLLQFLNKYVRSEKKSLNHNVELRLDIHSDLIEQIDKQVFIKGNIQKLKIVFDNLLDNAKKHAFIQDGLEYILLIEVLPFTGNEREASYLNYDIDGRKTYVEIKVSNTGKHFPKDFTVQDYARKNFSVGENANKGLGGYEVNEILKAHNDGKKALNLISYEEGKKYSSTISFIIPII